MDVHRSLLHWLKHAADAYGEDLPVAKRTPRAPVVVAPVAVEPVAVAAVAVAPVRVAPVRVAPPPREPTPAPVVAAPKAAPARPPIELPEGLDELRDLVLSCRRCRLHEGRTTVVFGEGDPQARVLFVGEAPGAREDETGRPFVGAAGQLLTKIIENAVGVPRASVYIANVNKCRPPNNRDPEPDEVAACLPYLRQQIRAIRPAVIVALGRVAAHNLLGTSLSMSQLRTKDLRYEGIPVVATWHPAYLLRQPEAKRDTWEDIKRVNRLLGRPEIPPPTAAR